MDEWKGQLSPRLSSESIRIVCLSVRPYSQCCGLTVSGWAASGAQCPFIPAVRWRLFTYQGGPSARQAGRLYLRSAGVYRQPSKRISVI
jgi:hypothetical protein